MDNREAELYSQVDVWRLQLRLGSSCKGLGLPGTEKVLIHAFGAATAGNCSAKIFRRHSVFRQPSPISRTTAPSRARGLRSGDLIVSIPDYWQWLNKTLPMWPEDICGVVSTAPCPAELIPSLVQKALNHMTEIYGSSETSGIGVRAWPDRTYRLMPHWKWGDSNDLGHTDLIHASGNRVLLMDRIEFLKDGSFLLAERQDGAVQVGGTNVYPAQIATLLLARPGVAKVAVRLMRPEEGVRLKAFIVPTPGASIEDVRRDLDSWIEKYLIVVERPKAMKFGPNLPINSSGQALDW